jgi:predicted nucleic acid-binding protein
MLTSAKQSQSQIVIGPKADKLFNVGKINMKIYLDNSCFNRPFDDQSQIRIRLESEAKLRIQEEIQKGHVELIWSYILDYENNRNPFQERKDRINGWKKYATVYIQESNDLIGMANSLNKEGFPKIDSLHIACAVISKCEYFLTTDDKVLKLSTIIKEININDPIGFIKEVLS